MTKRTQGNPTHRNQRLRITGISGRPAGGTWVKGTLMSFRFEALVFAEHAVYPDYEIGRSRISKLCVRRISDNAIVYAWDRGLDQPALEPIAEHAVKILCDKVAGIVHDARPTAHFTHAETCATGDVRDSAGGTTDFVGNWACGKLSLVNETLSTKLNPGRFPGMSPLMAAVVGYVLEESFTDPQIAEITVSEQENLVYFRKVGAVGFDGLQSLDDMRNNWNRLLDVAGLTPEERRHAVELFQAKVETVPGTQT